ELLPFAQTTYNDLEIQLGASFYHKKNIFKIFTSIKEQNDWLSKSEAPEFKNYVLAQNNYKLDNLQVPQPFGGFEITNAGYIDMPLFLNEYKKWLLQKELLAEEQIDYNAIKITDTAIFWKNIVARKIIFCEGYKSIENP